MGKQKLKNGFTALENLEICIVERTAVAETFEKAIQEQGLTQHLVFLIGVYYADEIKDSIAEAQEVQE